jgi:cytochrome c oxidase assembly protein subunit 11
VTLNANQKLFAKLATIAIGMFAFGYALVPFYYQICAAWGVNSLGEVRAEPLNTQVDRTRTITVEFDANAHGPWSFKPAQATLKVHPGELATVMYEFSNDQDRTMAAQAIPSYAPKQATAHFNKLECFCFAEHTLAPGEKKQWPVVFVIDPKLPKDVTTITLSYTFFEVAGKGPKT